MNFPPASIFTTFGFLSSFQDHVFSSGTLLSAPRPCFSSSKLLTCRSSVPDQPPNWSFCLISINRRIQDVPLFCRTSIVKICNQAIPIVFSKYQASAWECKSSHSNTELQTDVHPIICCLLVFTMQAIFCL